tara:strand:+ start:1043 stop:1354 length:312 start_codon:yes stop_codon:yes gene_type:complete
MIKTISDIIKGIFFGNDPRLDVSGIPKTLNKEFLEENHICNTDLQMDKMDGFDLEAYTIECGDFNVDSRENNINNLRRLVGVNYPTAERLVKYLENNLVEYNE